jgi:hypothetical protein
MRDISLKEVGYRLARWLIKELPQNSAKAIAGKADLVDLLSTPISLFSARARTEGQRNAKLPEEAKTIEWLE